MSQVKKRGQHTIVENSSMDTDKDDLTNDRGFDLFMHSRKKTSVVIKGHCNENPPVNLWFLPTRLRLRLRRGYPPFSGRHRSVAQSSFEHAARTCPGFPAKADKKKGGPFIFNLPLKRLYLPQWFSNRYPGHSPNPPPA